MTDIRLTRQLLAQFLPTQEAVKAFENLFASVQTDLPDTLESVQAVADTAQINAAEALSRLADIANALSLSLYGVASTQEQPYSYEPKDERKTEDVYIPPVALDKHAVGLSNVDNTSDANKPVSTAVTNALLTKAGTIQENWTVPTYSNSWVDFGGSFATGAYYKDNFGIVHLRGYIKSGTIGSAAFTLPAGYRPVADEVFVTTTSTGIGVCTISSAGSVTPTSGGNGSFSLSGISFRTS